MKKEKKSFNYETLYFSLAIEERKPVIYRIADAEIPIDWPVFEIDGSDVPALPEKIELRERRYLNDDIEQLSFVCRLQDNLRLTMELRLCRKTPFIRFRYVLSSDNAVRLTKKNGERLVYLSYPEDANAERTEIRLSEYDALTHGYGMRELPAFAHERELIGPILAERRGSVSMLSAYEHGSMYPDKYICFTSQDNRTEIRAIKGNYWNGQPLNRQPFEGVWLQFGAVKGDTDGLAKAYRAFQLYYCSLNAESRKPYIFYNTWAFQERNKFYNKQEYLTSMNEKRIEQEIDIAHRMGVDVFVIDTGWFSGTGDWIADPARFPSGMKHIQKLLEAKGMKLGLWFAPTTASVSSGMLRRNRENIQRKGGEEARPHPVWDTEDSYDMCPVSDYWEDFADRLIELSKTVGVRYFKWDAVEMFGCDRSGHHHGGEETTAQDRADNYSFRLGLYLSKIVDKLCAAIPDAIVDMDITEGKRYVGLGFLASGKYFALNNGPYYPNYDIQVPADQWINIFVNPGPARTWICRKTLCYDKWIPSVLMMTHYLPDDPAGSQLINLASLVLGQNGIWGDLPNVSDEGVKLFADVLGVYKQVRDDVTRADPVVYGAPGDLFEVHEKIDDSTGRGLISLFANANGRFEYKILSETKAAPVIFGDATVEQREDGHWITLKAASATAAILFFTGNDR